MKHITIVVAFFLLTPTAWAQENVVLPDLAPRVVEITGDLTISFPSLDRQPLVGFNPPPRVPEIPSSVQPYTETYKQSKDDLPPSPLRPPEAPVMSASSNRSPVQGMAEIGVGRYFERYLRANFSTPIDENTALHLAGQYEATDGHEPFSSTPDIESNHKYEFISAAIRRSGNLLQFGGQAGLSRRAYSLFGVVPVAVSPSLLDPSRKMNGWDLSGWVETLPGSEFSARLSVLARNTNVKTKLFNPAFEDDSTVKRSEDHLLVEGNLGVPIQDRRLTIDAHLSFQGLNTDGFPGRTIPSGSAAGSVQFESGEQLTIDAGLRIIGFDALGQAANAADRTLIYLSPDFTFDYELSPGTVLSFSNSPEISRYTTRDIYFLNPYVEDRPAVQPVLMPIHFNSSIKWSSELFQARAGFGWKDFKNYRFVENAAVPVNGFGEGYLVVNYDEASVFYVDGLVGATLAPGIQATLELAYRKGRLDEMDAAIPYFSPVTSSATILANLLSDRLQLKMIARGESTRFTDRLETSEVSSLLLFDIEGVYFVTPQAGIVAGVRDLGNSAEYWENYSSETSVFYAGARWRW